MKTIEKIDKGIATFLEMLPNVLEYSENTNLNNIVLEKDTTSSSPEVIVSGVDAEKFHGEENAVFDAEISILAISPSGESCLFKTDALICKSAEEIKFYSGEIKTYKNCDLSCSVNIGENEIEIRGVNGKRISWKIHFGIKNIVKGDNL